MPRLLLLTSAALGLLFAPSARAQGDAQELVRKAVQAAGGEEKLTPIRAVHSKIKGVLHEVEGAPFTGEVFRQGGDRLRYQLRAEVGGEVIVMLTVINGANSWIKINNETEPTHKPTQEAFKRSMHVDRATTLLPLLQDKGFTLTALGEAKKDERDLLGVRAAYKGQPDVLLYFDKEKGLLTRVEYRGIDDNTGKEVDSAVVYTDHREFDPAAPEEAALKAAKVGTDGPALLEYVRKRALSDAAKERIVGLVRRLGAEDFTQREEAARELVAAGGPAVPFLTEAAKDPDAEIAKRAQQCLDQIKGEQDAGATTAVVRLLGLRRPAGAAAALLDFLPAAAEAKLAREVRYALAAVAYTDGKPDAALAQALEHKDPARRAAVQEALKKEDGKGAEPPGRRLFTPGVKIATRITEYREGKKVMEWERLEVLFYNQFDDALFAKP